MVQLVKYFNENYGQQYGNIDYPRTSKEMYQVYQVIKSYGIKDDKLLELLNAIVLPKPKTNKEKEMFSECLYEVGKETLPKLSEFENDLYYYKRTPFLKITKDDFVFDESSKTWIYKQTPKLDWLINEKNISSKIGYVLHLTTISEKYLYTEKNNPFRYIEQYDNNSFILGFNDFEICNGCLHKINDGFETIIEDSFNIQTFKDLNTYITEFELELFKIEENKIPQETLDMNYIWKNFVMVYNDDLGLFKEDNLRGYLNYLLEEAFEEYDNAKDFLDDFIDNFTEISNFIIEHYSYSGGVLADVKVSTPYLLSIIKNNNQITYDFISSYKRYQIIFTENKEFNTHTGLVDNHQPELRFDNYGNLIVTIGDTSKTFTPMST